MSATELLIDPSTESDDVDTATVDTATVDTAVLAAELSPPEPEIELADLNDRIAAADARLTELTQDLGATGIRTDAAEARLAAVEESVAGSTASIAATSDRLTATEGRLESNDAQLGATNAAVTTTGEQIEAITGRLATVDERLAAADDQIATLRRRAADHDHALEDISRTIAAEVERHTSDALVHSQHSLQLAVNSIAQLALAMAESARDITADVSPESATALLDSFRVDLDAILAQLGFESLGTSVGATFDPHRHRALKRLPTAEAAQDKAITRVIRDGYRSTATGRILLFADVEVSRYLP